MMPSLGVISGETYLKHKTGVGHPESPARLEALLAALHDAEFPYLQLDALVATVEDIKLAHDFHYHDLVRIDVESLADQLCTGDTAICSDSYEVAMQASGAAVTAVNAVMSDKVKRVFCMTRPPGHHAAPDRGMGFCIFNHVAIAAKHALERHGLKRVVIVDWDVHHGNGTQEICINDDRIMFFSTHEVDIYPYTGSPIDDPLTINVELPHGADDNVVLKAWNEELLPRVESFKPELVLISAGFDAREGDPIGGLEFSDAGFAELTRHAVEIANAFAGGRVVSILEGGYDPKGLAKAAMAHCEVLSRL